jgi:uncharacterized repeat protein (TIGR03803 family)
MDVRGFAHLLGIGAAAVLLAACGESQPPLGAPAALPQGRAIPPEGARTPHAGAASSYRLLHSFGAGDDGRYPEAGLIDASGALYGTTYYGGTQGDGAVFRVTTAGTEKVLHSFGSSSDGANPEAGLTDVSGTLYGTTYYGGAHGDGTVFRITTAGTEKVLHSFGSSSDGARPRGGFDRRERHALRHYPLRRRHGR